MFNAELTPQFPVNGQPAPC